MEVAGGEWIHSPMRQCRGAQATVGTWAEIPSAAQGPVLSAVPSGPPYLLLPNYPAPKRCLGCVHSLLNFSLGTLHLEEGRKVEREDYCREKSWPSFREALGRETDSGA